MHEEPIAEYGGRYGETMLFTVLAYIFLLMPLLLLAEAVGITNIFSLSAHQPTTLEMWLAFFIMMPFAAILFRILTRLGRRRGALLQIFNDKVVYTEWRTKPKSMRITRQTHIEGQKLVTPSESGPSETICLAMLMYKSEFHDLTQLVEELSKRQVSR